MTPAEYGRWLASQTPPLTEEQRRQAVRILVEVRRERREQQKAA